MSAAVDGALLAALPPEVLAALSAGAAGGGVLAVAAGLSGRPAGAPGRPALLRRAPQLSRRVLLSAGAGVLALVLTRWLVAALGVGLLVACWGRLFGAGAEAGRGIARLEALATWTESLRDTIAGAVGLEQATPVQ
ncbi:hypothetical protein [Kineococcus gypseus]|uniref:hypothetical protein n=1 Tax=Kineococcus gypseus TaxID=1637102 RepID=UPI003D7D43FE